MKISNLEKHIKDSSSEKQFQFSFCCQLCGGEWRSRMIPFSRAGSAPASDEKKVVFQVMYQREYEKAKKHSLNDAKDSFNICPICGRLVCDSCFMICDDVDMCTECSERLKEAGKRVSELSIDEAKKIEAVL